MELNWSTFLLEIFNFLILVWILKRFLYQPILDAIARRRTAIEDQLEKSEQLHAEANILKERYENRLTDWDKERQKAMEKLMLELEENRRQQLEALKEELAEEEEKIMWSGHDRRNRSHEKSNSAHYSRAQSLHLDCLEKLSDPNWKIVYLICCRRV